MCIYVVGFNTVPCGKIVVIAFPILRVHVPDFISDKSMLSSAEFISVNIKTIKYYHDRHCLLVNAGMSLLEIQQAGTTDIRPTSIYTSML